MIFSIQNNSAALTTMRNLNQAGFSMGKSMEKLSSGYRINTAAAGPADLIASEQLRARIEGLEKAIQNVRTSGNVMDIADGALGQVQNIVRDMRQLAIHAMNSGVTNGEQIASDQAQLDVGLQAIDRILNTTNYAGRKLLDSLDLGGKYGFTGTLVVDGRNAGETEETPSEPLKFSRNKLLETLTSNPDAAPAADAPSAVDEDGKLLTAKTFSIVGRDGNPDTMETINFAAGTSLDEMVAKLREYAIPPEAAGSLDPDFTPPTIREGDDGNQVTLSLDTLAHIQSANDADAADFLGGYMKNFAAPLKAEQLGVLEFDRSLLSESELALYDLSQNLMNINMPGLGSTEVVVGHDKEGNDILQTFSLQDLYSPGAASLAKNPSAALSVLNQTNKDISSARAEIAAKRKYGVEAEENLLFNELESYTRMESFLRDTDFASEIPRYVRSQMVSQVGTQMLSATMENNKSLIDLLA